MATGLASAAATPIAPNAASPTTPTHRRYREAIPRAIAARARTTPIPASRTDLSLGPNVRIAAPFSHSGVASITLWPTVRTGNAPGFTIPATSKAVPIATPPTISPTSEPVPTARPRRRRAEGSGARPPAAVGSVSRGSDDGSLAVTHSA